MLCAVCDLVPVLVFDGLLVGGLMFSSTEEAFGAPFSGLAEAFFGVNLNGVGAGAVSTEEMALNNVSPSMSTPRIFCATSDISLRTFDFFSTVYGSFGKI